MSPDPSRRLNVRLTPADLGLLDVLSGAGHLSKTDTVRLALRRLALEKGYDPDNPHGERRVSQTGFSRWLLQHSREVEPNGAPTPRAKVARAIDAVRASSPWYGEPLPDDTVEAWSDWTARFAPLAPSSATLIAGAKADFAAVFAAYEAERGALPVLAGVDIGTGPSLYGLARLAGTTAEAASEVARVTGWALDIATTFAKGARAAVESPVPPPALPRGGSKGSHGGPSRRRPEPFGDDAPKAHTRIAPLGPLLGPKGRRSSS
jgi:hypothetical protein